MPTEDGSRADNEQGGTPARTDFSKCDPEPTIPSPKSGRGLISEEDCDLVAERKVLQAQEINASWPCGSTKCRTYSSQDACDAGRNPRHAHLLLPATRETII